ncbi:zf-HC2 domain-containing protein [Sphingomonas sp.]|jgi:anti-sigma factor RsiW|uniref:zf-HC2 domain-containing protein n=1 Tax=Sphingomonas sp. TaxID=28214 RepID=UPI002E342BF9|nr:zf-HC2 domain-containing protein [Sphingomonas sp.]HEX4695426.1 zf-HC2 domain-containing protein [Sphingomonas sp.]
MADIIKLRGSPHEQAQRLLSWYVNETLDAEEKALVDAHLAECAECRAELAGEEKLARAIATLSIDAEHGWSMLSERIDASPTPRRLAEPVPFVRRKVSIGWAFATPLAAAAAVAFAIIGVQPTAQPGQIYRALGSAPTAQPGNIVLMFKPDANDRDMRAALAKADARVVDGPSAAGAYVLSVVPAKREQALAGLRASPLVVLAEPIDAGPPR